MARWKENMTVHKNKVLGLIGLGAVIVAGFAVKVLSMTFVPSFTLSLTTILAPMAVLGVAGIVLLIKEMK